MRKFSKNKNRNISEKIKEEEFQDKSGRNSVKKFLRIIQTKYENGTSGTFEDRTQKDGKGKIMSDIEIFQKVKIFFPFRRVPILDSHFGARMSPTLMSLKGR